MELSISKDFSKNPLLRYCSLSERSGEEFYHTVLNRTFKECYEKKEHLTVNLDYTEGYAPSFLDESFGNLVYDFGLAVVDKLLDIVSDEEPFWINSIKDYYKKWEQRRQNGQAPTVTKEHEPWYRLSNGKLECKTWLHPSASN